jgi:hypothetical protein
MPVAGSARIVCDHRRAALRLHSAQGDSTEANNEKYR